MQTRGMSVSRLLRSAALGFTALLLAQAIPMPVGAARVSDTEPSARAVVASDDKAGDDFLASLEAAKGEKPEEEEAPLYVTAVGFIVKLGLVLALAYATILGLRKFTALKGSVACGRQRIRVLENSTIGAGKMLHLVEIGPRKLLLASTPNQISLVAELGPDDLPDVPVAAPAGFKEQLGAFLGQPADSESAEHNVADMLRKSTSYLRDRIGDVGSTRRKLRGTSDG